MATDERYNGWANYATWRVKLEICDDYISSRIDEIVDDIDRGIMNLDELNSQQDWVDELQQAVDDAITNYGGTEEGLAVDYARSFVADADYWEIAEHAMDQLTEALAYAAMENAQAAMS